MHRLARSSQGMAQRWTGSIGQSALHDLHGTIVPVVIMGHETTDDGAMRGLAASPGPGLGLFAGVRVTSTQGFLLWGIDITRSPSGPASFRYRVSQTAQPGTVLGAPVYLYGSPRDVVGFLVEHAVFFAGMVLTQGAADAVIHDFARPIVVPPGFFFEICDVTANDSFQASLLFEEGR